MSASSPSPVAVLIGAISASQPWSQADADRVAAHAGVTDVQLAPGGMSITCTVPSGLFVRSIARLLPDAPFHWSS